MKSLLVILVFIGSLFADFIDKDIQKCKNGDFDVCLKLGDYFIKIKKYDKTLLYLEDYCEKDKAIACSFIGAAYYQKFLDIKEKEEEKRANASSYELKLLKITDGLNKSNSSKHISIKKAKDYFAKACYLNDELGCELANETNKY